MTSSAIVPAARFPSQIRPPTSPGLLRPPQPRRLPAFKACRMSQDCRRTVFGMIATRRCPLAQIRPPLSPLPTCPEVSGDHDYCHRGLPLSLVLEELSGTPITENNRGSITGLEQIPAQVWKCCRSLYDRILPADGQPIGRVLFEDGPNGFQREERPGPVSQARRSVGSSTVAPGRDVGRRTSAMTILGKFFHHQNAIANPWSRGLGPRF